MQGHGDPSFLHGDTSWSEEGGVEAKADDSTQAELGRDCSLRFLRHRGGRFWAGQSRERLCGEREPQECAQGPLGSLAEDVAAQAQGDSTTQVGPRAVLGEEPSEGSMSSVITEPAQQGGGGALSVLTCQWKETRWRWGNAFPE